MKILIYKICQIKFYLNVFKSLNVLIQRFKKCVVKIKFIFHSLIHYFAQGMGKISDDEDSMMGDIRDDGMDMDGLDDDDVESDSEHELLPVETDVDPTLRRSDRLKGRLKKIPKNTMATRIGKGDKVWYNAPARGSTGGKVKNENEKNRKDRMVDRIDIEDSDYDAMPEASLSDSDGGDSEVMYNVGDYAADSDEERAIMASLADQGGEEAGNGEESGASGSSMPVILPIVASSPEPSKSPDDLFGGDDDI